MLAPTIIIGLGGTGSEIAARVAQLATEEQKKRIRFVGIDTDVNDLNKLKKMERSMVTIQTSAPYIISDYLENNTHARDTWFPCHNILMGKTPTEGAGQVRAISRLAFDTAVREGRLEKLDRAIEDLYRLNGDAAPQAMRVMIISTLAGGTGSGIVLPLALYVKHFLTTRFQKNASVIRGFFILPEVFFPGKSPEERNNLCCNAYAALRELDAFMRKGDGALSGAKYRGLRLDLPDSGTGEYVDYKEEPFNFCFLYDAKNTDNMKLNSLNDYKAHAANTIYAQAVSCMSSRSNSSEDNTIRTLVATNGRNRFCGAGSSMLYYPKDEVHNYISDKWALQSMNKEWLQIDKDFFEYDKDQKIKKRKNPGIEIMRQGEYYVQQIDTSNDDAFLRAIRSMCTQSLDNETRTGNWELYIKELSSHAMHLVMDVDKNVVKVKSDFEEKIGEIETIVQNNMKDEGNKVSTEDIMGELAVAAALSQDYLEAVEKAATLVSQSLISDLFETDKDFTETNSRYRMESWMRDADGKFIHPNAARYFLYNLKETFQDLAEKAQKAVTEDFRPTSGPSELDVFDDESTKGTVETAHSRIPMVVGGKKFFIFKNDKKGTAFMLNKFKEFAGSPEEEGVLQDYAKQKCHSLIYAAGAAYAAALCESYEMLYKKIEAYIRSTAAEAAMIEKKFQNGDGKATRFVCASKTCLEKMSEELVFAGDSFSVNGELSAEIFNKMKTYALMKQKPANDIYFQELYSDVIMPYWKRMVSLNYSSEINMDIITALEKEMEYMNGVQPRKEIDAYVREVIESANRLAAPFIEEPMGQIRHPLTACGYNKEILGTDPDGPRAALVHEILDELGGSPDEEVEPNMLLLYHALYGLAASDLKRFQGPTERDEQGGVYYAAYFNLINELGPIPSENKALTPHLDKNWHLTKYMPDLDDRNQALTEEKIYQAMVWGLISGEIRQDTSNSNVGHTSVIYCPKNKRSKDFLVSNNSPCDELFEVQDALAINPPQVEALIADFAKCMNNEKKDRVQLVDSTLIRRMNWFNKMACFGEQCEEEDANDRLKFKVVQYAPEQKASIFDLIYWIKYSMPVDDYVDGDIELLIHCLIHLIEKYVACFIDATTAKKVCYEILLDQYRLFLKNMKDPELKVPKNVNRIDDSVITKVADMLETHFEEKYEMKKVDCEKVALLLDDARMK